MTGRSDHLNKLATALTKAQSQIQPAFADAIGLADEGDDTQAYRYATLTSVWKAVRGALSKNGLAVVQTCEPGEAGELRLVTTLLHTSGQWISGTAVLSLAAPTPQAYGSALTYARRYGLAAIVGLCVDQDDDGVGASRPSNRESSVSAHGAQRETDNAGAWWKLPWKDADAKHLKAFARAYARAKGVGSVDQEEVRRDFAIEGGLADYFGATPLGEIVAGVRSRRLRRSSSGTAPSEDVHSAREAA
jgi:ERF superfamily